MFGQTFADIILEKKLIFCFHKVSEEDGSLHLLEYAITRLLKLGYKILPLDEAMDYKDSKVAVLTFDDGYQSFYRKAYGVLKKYSIRATVFLITDSIDKNTFSALGSDTVPTIIDLDPPLATTQIKELKEYGIEFGDHMHTHRRTTEITNDEMRKELALSIKRIEEITSERPVSFCYPEGFVDEGKISLLKEFGLKYAVVSYSSTGGDSKLRNKLGWENNYLLPRIGVLKGWKFYLAISKAQKFVFKFWLTSVNRFRKLFKIGIYNALTGLYKRYIYYKIMQKIFKFAPWHVGNPYELSDERDYKKRIVEELNQLNLDTVVELGCGLGEIIKRIKATRKYGIDIDDKAIAFAARHNTKGVIFKNGSFRDVLTLGIKKIDCLIMVNWTFSIEPEILKKEMDNLIGNLDITYIVTESIAYECYHNWDELIGGHYQCIKTISDLRRGEILKFYKKIS